jgi:hypothetical protein
VIVTEGGRVVICNLINIRSWHDSNETDSYAKLGHMGSMYSVISLGSARD